MAGDFEFTLVGRGALAIACTRHIVDRGWPVRALVSSDADALAWGAGAGLRCASDLALLGEVPVGEGSVLLSVSNDRLIPAQLLERFPLAVNFHDAPLPQYSGSHATSWALMAREREYSITWHRMTARADAGEILLQVPVALAAGETAFSLNGKCHEAALSSFPQLIESIVSRSVSGRPQNPARRVFYPRDRRPERLAVLDFRQPAHDLEALARALSYGDYPNRLGLPKVWTGGGFLVARQVDVMAARSRAAPGTLLRVAADTMEIATSTHDVRLRGLSGLDGGPPDASALREGDRLVSEGPALDEAIAAASACPMRDEEAWVARFRELKPLVLPFAASSSGAAGSVDVEGPAADRKQVLGNVLAWLSRITGTEGFDIGMEDASDRGALVAGVRPFRAGEDLADWEARAPYLRDALLRYPRVPMPVGWKHFADWPVVVGFALEPRAACTAALHIGIDAASGLVRLASPTGIVPSAALREMAAQLQLARNSGANDVRTR